jgi:hypothetical protein
MLTNSSSPPPRLAKNGVPQPMAQILNPLNDCFF